VIQTGVPHSSEVVQFLQHQSQLKELNFLLQKLNFGKIVWQCQAGSSQKVQNVTEHISVAIDEVVLLESI